MSKLKLLVVQRNERIQKQQQIETPSSDLSAMPPKNITLPTNSVGAVFHRNMKDISNSISNALPQLQNFSANGRNINQPQFQTNFVRNTEVNSPTWTKNPETFHTNSPINKKFNLSLTKNEETQLPTFTTAKSMMSQFPFLLSGDSNVETKTETKLSETMHFGESNKVSRKRVFLESPDEIINLEDSQSHLKFQKTENKEIQSEIHKEEPVIDKEQETLHPGLKGPKGTITYFFSSKKITEKSKESQEEPKSLPPQAKTILQCVEQFDSQFTSSELAMLLRGSPNMKMYKSSPFFAKLYNENKNLLVREIQTLMDLNYLKKIQGKFSLAKNGLTVVSGMTAIDL